MNVVSQRELAEEKLKSATDFMARAYEKREEARRELRTRQASLKTAEFELTNADTMHANATKDYDAALSKMRSLYCDPLPPMIVDPTIRV